MNIYILKWEDYYSRRIRRCLSLSDYIDQGATLVHTTMNANFYRGDGVNASFNGVHCDASEVGNYMLVADGNEIVSRWFIIEVDAINKGVSNLLLRRDLVCDYYDEVQVEPCNVERSSYLPDGDPAIFNKEPNFTFNQIKTDEFLLPDETGCAWLVGYVSRNAPENTTKYTFTRALSSFDAQYNTLDDWNDSFMVKTVGGNANPNYRQVKALDALRSYIRSTITTDVRSSGMGRSDRERTAIHNANLVYQSITAESDAVTAGSLRARGQYYGVNASIGEQLFSYDIAKRNEVFASICAAFGLNSLDSDTILKAYDGKIIKIGAGSGARTYKVNYVNDGDAVQSLASFKESEQPRLMQALLACVNEEVVSVVDGGDYAFAIEGRTHNGHLELVESYEELTATIDVNTAEPWGGPVRARLEDAPYDMFCMPYNLDGRAVAHIGSDATTSSIEVDNKTNMEIATTLFSNMGGGSGGISDIQILPYCPLRESELYIQDGVMRYRSSQGAATEVLDTNQNLAAVILWCSRSSFSKTIPNYSIEGLSKYYRITGQSAQKLKIRNCTELVRLVSPNSNGTFEFSIIENKGLEGFDVDCTYKPYSPYIHIAPIFGGLYGRDFDDARGLVCNGDYSISLMTNAWETYQITNKNYENIFNRQIKSMELQNTVSLASDIVGAIGGTIGGAAAGAFGAGKIGMPGVTGAVIGGITSAGAGAASVAVKQMLREDNMSLTKDLHKYELGNIQALPESISKVSSITKNNKYVPFLEIYSATDQEIENFRYYLRYSGATINRIASHGFAEWLGDYGRYTYMKAKIFMYNNISADFHELNSLADELANGVYFYNERRDG